MDRYDDYLPCYRKSECDVTATRKLLALSSSESPREYGDLGHLTHLKKKRERHQPAPYKETLDFNTTLKQNSREDVQPKIMTAADIYERLRIRENTSSIALDFCSWQLCPSIHAETVKYGIIDASHLKPQIRKANPLINRNINSAISKLTTRSSTSPTKLCMSSISDRPKSVNSRPSSCSPGKEEIRVLQEPPHPLPIHYSFKYHKHSCQYSDQYRQAISISVEHLS